MTTPSLPLRSRRALRDLRGLRGLALAVVFGLSTAIATAAPVDDMRRMIDAGQLDLAYQTAMKNPALIGHVHFDFLYGLAAIGTGHVPEGLLALERHLAAVPANDRARLELARGYFLIGEYGRARSEFEFVLRYNPPAGVRANIERYLEAMTLREGTDRRSTSRFYAEFGVGHDSNVNGGTYHDELQLPFGNISLINSPSVGQSDTFTEVAVGGERTMRISNRLSVFGGADVDYKRNNSLHDFDLLNVNANIGFSVLAGNGLYRGTLSGNTFQVGGSRYRDTIGIGAEAAYTLTPNLSLLLFGQYSEFRHTNADVVRDADAKTLGGMLTQNFPALPYNVTAGVRLSYTQEDNLRLRPDLARHVPLVRVFAAASPAERWRVAAGFTEFAQNFGAEDLAFGSTRADSASSWDLTATYVIAPNWTVRAEYVSFYNHSNQNLYDFKRQTIALKTRYQY